MIELLDRHDEARCADEKGFMRMNRGYRKWKSGRRSVSVAAACMTLGMAACGTGGGGDADSLTLRFASGLPENLYASEAYLAWADDVEELTDGQVEFENYFAGALVPQDEVIKAVSDDQIQLGQFAPNTDPDQFKYSSIDSVPGSTTDLGAVISTYRDFYETKAAVEEEWSAAGMVPILYQPTAANVFASNKSVDSVDDISGMRVRASGAMLPVLEELGATTVTLPQVEVYEGLQRSVVDGATSLTLASAASQSFGEVASHIYDIGLPAAGMLVVAMNKVAYDDLPQDVKDALAKASENADKAWLERLSKIGAKACEPLAAQGAELIEWDDARKQELQDAAFEVAQEIYIDTIDDGEQYWSDWQESARDYDGHYGNSDGGDLAACLS